MKHIRTRIALPPGLLSNATVREVLRLVFEEFQWFPPVRYGWADTGNFLGPPFVEMFGDRLKSVPESCRRDPGDGIVLLEPYPLPGDAETEAGKARERELIALLGPECFYDHAHHTLPTRRPDLSRLRPNP